MVCAGKRRYVRGGSLSTHMDLHVVELSSSHEPSEPTGANKDIGTSELTPEVSSNLEHLDRIELDSEVGKDTAPAAKTGEKKKKNDDQSHSGSSPTKSNVDLGKHNVEKEMTMDEVNSTDQTLGGNEENENSAKEDDKAENDQEEEAKNKMKSSKKKKGKGMREKQMILQQLMFLLKKREFRLRKQGPSNLPATLILRKLLRTPEKWLLRNVLKFLSQSLNTRRRLTRL
ncbi:hypothetical protein AAZX31_02G028700 [Glycine max]|nr:hypothetical protein GLYMA_02G030300v4 [Glycine max]RZC23153.1 hypothetical protein D0Y65_002821 [Glycine soja]